VGEPPAAWPGDILWKVDQRAPAIDGTVWAAWASPEVNFNPFRLGVFRSTGQPGQSQAAKPAATSPAASPVDRDRSRIQLLEQLNALESQIDQLKNQLKR
jgi:hypothetical protein